MVLYCKENEEMKFNLKYFSDYRTPLMGIAAIMVVFCHAHKYGVSMPNILAQILRTGGLGVDIFLLLSGIGCYYSLSKNGQVEIGSWYKRRLIRILVPYTLMQIPFWGYWLYVGSFDFFDCLYEFSTIKFWILHKGAWYVALLLPLYIITPPLYRLLEICKKKRLFVVAVLAFGIISLCYMDLDNINNECWVDNLRWAFQRTVSFVIGMGIAPYVKHGKSVNLLWLFGVCFLFYFFVHKIISKNIFMGWCQIPFFLVVFVYILRYLKQKKTIYRFICWMGVVSLESYLANIYLCGAIFDFSKRIGWNDAGCYMEYLLVMVLGILLSWIVNHFSCRINNRIK